MSVLVGGVGELYQGDFDLGRRAAERLSTEALGDDVVVEELTYGAVAVVHRLRELRPDALIVVGAAERRRRPGTVELRRIGRLDLPIEEVQLAVFDGSTGHVTIDLLLRVASGFEALPDRTAAIEVQPARGGPSETMSPQAEAGLEEALGLVRAEVIRARRELDRDHRIGRAAPPGGRYAGSSSPSLGAAAGSSTPERRPSSAPSGSNPPSGVRRTT